MGKSKATKPTRVQKILMDKLGMNAKDWLILSDTPEKITFVRRGDGSVKTVKKAEIPAGGAAGKSK